MEISKGIKPYYFHGVELRSGSKEAVGECPFCGKEEKFSVDVETGKWRCFVCDEGGNQYTFMRKLWEESYEAEVDYSELSVDRKLKSQTLRDWGVTKSLITGDWIVPGYNVKGEITQVYRYALMKGGRRKLLATPEASHGLHGVNNYDPKKKVIYLCEGPWDAMRLWEKLKHTKEKGGRFVKSATKDNLLTGANVLAVPGCYTFQDSWCDVFLKKRVYIAYDNDHPRKHPKTGKIQEPPSLSGTKKVSAKIGNRAEVMYYRWGKEGYDSTLPDGTDMRDLLSSKKLREILNKFSPIPDEWKKSDKEQKIEANTSPLKCRKWVMLSNKWRTALEWTDGLDISLSVMLASIISTELMGDQLWVKIIGPASCGKSTLCEAVSTNKRYVLAKSTMRGFHSGFKSDGKGEEDNSLISQVDGKTLVTKDGDTLLQAPNLPQILSEARDIYDRVSRTHYRNKMSREYVGVNITWILCGTSSLRSIDSSELGERFLDCVIMEHIDDAMEDEVLMRVALREDKNLGKKSTGGEEDEKQLIAKRMTGGYVDFLRDNASELVGAVSIPTGHLSQLTRLGKFVSFMRARPSSSQTESVEREFAARLVSQLTRLAKCLAAVMNRKTVDKEVMRRVKKVANDTARGVTLDICFTLYEEGGSDVRYLSLVTDQTEENVRVFMRFLKAIKVVEQYHKKVKGRTTQKKLWRLRENIKTLFEECF